MILMAWMEVESRWMGVCVIGGMDRDGGVGCGMEVGWIGIGWRWR